MTRRILALLLCLPVIFAACSGGETTDSTSTTTSTSTTSTTSTTLPPTTTTTTPFTVKDAPDGLTNVVKGFYAYASKTADKAPRAPKPVIKTIKPTERKTPKNGSASVGTFKGQRIAVVNVQDDIFLAVEDKKGWKIAGGRWPSLNIPNFYGRGPRLVAVVGSDARPGQDVASSRADSIHFVGLDGRGDGAVVGVPRDSYVTVPGHWTTKITESLAMGGPETMMATFDELTGGLPFEGYVLTGFAGFEELAGAVLGGVEVEVPFSINDRWAHVALEAGRQMLDGAQALGFARARKTVPNGDFTRSEHQGMILVSAAKMVKGMGYAMIPKLLEAAEPHLITNLSPEQLLTFSAMTISTNLGKVSNTVAPGSPGWAGSASVVYLSSSVNDLWDDLADGRLDS